MKKKNIVLIAAPIAVIALSLATYIAVTGSKNIVIQGGFGKGQNFLRGFSDTERQAYVQGFINGITIHPFLNVGNSYDVLIRCIETKKDSEMATILSEYFSENPRMLEGGLNVHSFNALMIACRKQS